MKPALCRRDFVTRGFLLAGAALLLPVGRLAAAAASLPDRDPLALGPQDVVLRTAFAFVGRYGSVESVTTTNQTTRIVAHVSNFDSMAQILGTARDHGISRIRASGTVTTFELEGRRFEIENLYHAA